MLNCRMWVRSSRFTGLEEYFTSLAENMTEALAIVLRMVTCSQVNAGAWTSGHGAGHDAKELTMRGDSAYSYCMIRTLITFRNGKRH